MIRPSKFSVDSHAQQACVTDPCNVDISNADQREWAGEGSPVEQHHFTCDNKRDNKRL